jgi:hypothetical protein
MFVGRTSGNEWGRGWMVVAPLGEWEGGRELNVVVFGWMDGWLVSSTASACQSPSFLFEFLAGWLARFLIRPTNQPTNYSSHLNSPSQQFSFPNIVHHNKHKILLTLPFSIVIKLYFPFINIAPQ